MSTPEIATLPQNLDDLPIELTLSETELEAHREHITTFIADLVADADADGALIALSGGIDSTLTAHLAVEALGTDRVRGLVMPADVSTDRNMSDAERVAEMLGIAYDVVDIEPIVQAFFEAYPDGPIAPEEADAGAAGTAGAPDPLHTATGNVRVRTRAVLNYFVANADNRIVLGTGNRSEALAGYYTKYGDQAVDCNPIGNLYKRQVRQLAAHVGVPEDLVTKPASAEMWSGQTDEDELGMTYDLLDAILALHVDGPLSASATARTLDIDPELIDRVEHLYEVSAHKRSMPPAPAPLDAA